MNRRDTWMFSAVTAATLFLGCTATPAGPAVPPSPPSLTAGTITLRIPNTTTKFDHVTVDGENIRGPNIELSRFGEAYRGLAYGEAVDLHWDGDTLVGRIGNGTPTSLRFRQFADGFTLEGMFSGSRGLVVRRSNQILAIAGARRFELITDDGLLYRDMRNNTVRAMEVVLSPEVVALPAREQAVALAMFLRH